MGSRPAAEPAARGDRALRRAEHHPRGSCADRRPPARAVAGDPRPDRRPPLRDLDRRLDRRHLRDRVLADPRVRNRPAAGDRGGRALRRRHALRVCRAPRRRRPSRWAARSWPAPPRSRSRPRPEGRSARRARNWSPLYRRAGRQRTAADGYRRPHAPVREGHEVPPAERRGRRREPVPPLRQLVPERDDQGAPVRDGIPVPRTTSTSPAPTSRR